MNTAANMEDDHDIHPPPDSSTDDFTVKKRSLVREDSSESDFACGICQEPMVEPTTLECGHSFCRLCLAQWYLTNKKKVCSTCRQIWQGHPKVNITLRDMMHKMFGTKIYEREERVRDSDSMETIQKFDELLLAQRSDNEQGRRRVDKSSLWMGFGLGIGLFLVVFNLVWYWTDVDQDLLIHKPAVQWKTEDVVTWLTHMGWAEQYVHSVQQNGIDGPMMLSLDEESIEGALNVTNALHKKALLLAINRILEKGVKLPSTLWEYKVMYPGRCMFLLFGLKDAPRGVLLYLFIFYYEDVFLPFLHFTTPAQTEDVPFNWSQIPAPTGQQWVTFLTNAVLLPYWLIAKFTWSVFSRQFWTSIFILVTCALLSIMEASTIKRFFLQAEWRSPLQKIKIYMKLVATAFVCSLMWPFIPRFICDFFFYASLYLTPIQLARTISDQML